MKKMSALFALLAVATLSANANLAEQKPAKTEQKSAKAAEQKTEAKAPAAKANTAAPAAKAPAATTQK
jgi:hypothetical protein